MVSPHDTYRSASRNRDSNKLEEKQKMKRPRSKGKRARKRLGVLTFEWILLVSLLVIGVIGGLSAVRNALICELWDLSQCISAIDMCGCNKCGPPVP